MKLNHLNTSFSQRTLLFLILVLLFGPVASLACLFHQYQTPNASLPQQKVSHQSASEHAHHVHDEQHSSAHHQSTPHSKHHDSSELKCCDSMSLHSNASRLWISSGEVNNDHFSPFLQVHNQSTNYIDFSRGSPPSISSDDVSSHSSLSLYLQNQTFLI